MINAAMLLWTALQIIFVAVVVLCALSIIDSINTGWYYNIRARRRQCGVPLKKRGYFFNIGTIFRSLIENQKGGALESLLLVNSFSSTLYLPLLSNHNFFTKDPANIKAILATQFPEFGIGYRQQILEPLLGKGIFNSDGFHWKTSRTMLRPIFTRERVSKLSLIESHMEGLFNALDQETDTGFVDAQTTFLNLTFDTSLHFLFGVHFDSLGNPEQTVDTLAGAIKTLELDRHFRKVSNWIGVRARLGNLYFCASRFFCDKEISVIKSFADSIVSNVVANSSEKACGDNDEGEYSFVEELAQHTNDKDEIRDQALTMFVAGRSTTASLMTQLTIELSNRPDLWAKFRESVLSAVGTDKSGITFESLKRCSYLKWCLDEMLRLVPNVPINIRIAHKDTTLPRGGGPDECEPIFLPKGSNIMYNSYALHRDTAIWGEDAHEFRPERWKNMSPPHWSYIPFNGGPRICLGQQFALSEVAYVFSRLAQTYERIEPSPMVSKRELRFKLNATVFVEPGVPVRFHRYQKP